MLRCTTLSYFNADKFWWPTLDEHPQTQTAIFIHWQLAGPSRAQMFSLAACNVLECPNTAYFYFILCWPCISLQILANNQLDALFHVFIYFTSLHILSVTALIIRRSNCINISSGMISLCKRLLGMLVRSEIQFPPDRHTKQSHRLITPGDVLIQFDILMMSAVMLETCRDMK
jgi:hypothetical protein